MRSLRENHWDAAIHVICYLKGNPGQGIIFQADSDLKLTAWCDTDWGTCPINRRSLTSWFIQLGRSLVSWKTRQQERVSRSSTEAEYWEMADTVSEIHVVMYTTSYFWS